MIRRNVPEHHLICHHSYRSENMDNWLKSYIVYISLTFDYSINLIKSISILMIVVHCGSKLMTTLLYYILDIRGSRIQ